VVLLNRVDAALSDDRVENRRGQVRSPIDPRNRLSGRLERWLRDFGLTRAARSFSAGARPEEKTKRRGPHAAANGRRSPAAPGSRHRRSPRAQDSAREAKSPTRSEDLGPHDRPALGHKPSRAARRFRIPTGASVSMLHAEAFEMDERRCPRACNRLPCRSCSRRQAALPGLAPPPRPKERSTAVRRTLASTHEPSGGVSLWICQGVFRRRVRSPVGGPVLPAVVVRRS
jgi:hypothetical protein